MNLLKTVGVLQNSHLLFLLLIVFFSLLGSLSLFQPHLFSAHDIWHNIARFHHYYHSVAEGNFPPYWVYLLSYGYGYPLFLFSYHLPWIIGLPLPLLGISIPTSYKILLFISFLISGLTMYSFCYSITKQKLLAFLASILYMWAPFHFLTLFVANAAGVLFVFSFLPFFLQGLYLLSDSKDARGGIIVTSLGFAAIVLSHLISVIFALPAITAFLIWCTFRVKKRSKFFINLSISLILGLLLSSFYLIPAVYYSKFTSVREYGGFTQLYRNNFIDFSQLLYSKWGYGPITTNAKDGEISFQLGIAQWLSVAAVIVLILLKKSDKKFKVLTLLLLGALSLNIFLMLDYSAFLWELIVRVVTLDYPFRFLLPATFISSLLIPIALTNFNKKIQIIVCILFIAIALYTNRNHVKTNMVVDIPYMHLVAGEITTNTLNEYRPIDSDHKLIKNPGPKIVPEDLKISSITQSYREFSLTIEATQSTKVSIGHFDFPGMSFYIDNVRTPHTKDGSGRISAIIPSGTHRLKAQFEKTPLIIISNSLTIVGIAVIIYLVCSSLNLLMIKERLRIFAKK